MTKFVSKMLLPGVTGTVCVVLLLQSHQMKSLADERASLMVLDQQAKAHFTALSNEHDKAIEVQKRNDPEAELKQLQLEATLLHIDEAELALLRKRDQKAAGIVDSNGLRVPASESLFRVKSETFVERFLPFVPVSGSGESFAELLSGYFVENKARPSEVFYVPSKQLLIVRGSKNELEKIRTLVAGIAQVQ